MQEEKQGLLIPMRRDRKRDWANGTGAELLRSKVLQALMTSGATPRSAGELPWRTAELARVHVRDALRRWVPGAEITSLEVAREDASLTIRLRVREKETGTEAQVEVTQ